MKTTRSFFQAQRPSREPKLLTKDGSIDGASAVDGQDSITLAFIAPLTFVHPLLTAPYLNPDAAYTLLMARAAAWRWDVPLAPLMTCLWASLFKVCASINSLTPLKMADQITVSRHCLQHQMVPRSTLVQMAPTPTYISHQAQQAPPPAPVKKKTPAERGDLQATALFWISNATATDKLQEIWHTLAPLTKEKACLALEIACRTSACVLRCKAPRVTHAVQYSS